MNKHEFWHESPSDRYVQLNRKELKFTALHPKIVDMVRHKTVHKILDFGCGVGVLANQMAQINNVTVYGVDISGEAIKQAKSLYQTQPNLQFKQIDIFDYQAFENLAPFDVVVICLVLDILSNEEEIASLFNRIFKYISSNGRLIIGDAHPCFKDEIFTTVSFNIKKESYSKNEASHKIELFDPLTGEKEVEFRATHYPLETLVKLICQAGFLISDMDEIYDIDDNTFHPDIRKRFNSHQPPYLLIEATKPNNL